MKVIEKPQTIIYYEVECECEGMKKYNHLFSADEKGVYFLDNDMSARSQGHPWKIPIKFCPFCGRGLESP